MTKDQILARLGELNQRLQQLEGAINQGYADLNATRGAKEDCEFWLHAIAKEEHESKANDASNIEPIANE